MLDMGTGHRERVTLDRLKPVHMVADEVVVLFQVQVSPTASVTGHSWTTQTGEASNERLIFCYSSPFWVLGGGCVTDTRGHTSFPVGLWVGGCGWLLQYWCL